MNRNSHQIKIASKSITVGFAWPGMRSHAQTYQNLSVGDLVYPMVVATSKIVQKERLIEFYGSESVFSLMYNNKFRVSD